MVEKNKYKNWLKSVSAFVNGSGGKIIFGIDDANNLVGLENSKEDSEIISEIIKTKLDPSPNIELSIINKDNKDYIILNVLGGKETPYYLIESKSRLAYIRIGNESVLANSSQVKNLILRGINKTYDALSSDIKRDKVTFDRLKTTYYSSTNLKLEESDLESFNLINGEGYLTNAGALFADGRQVYQSRIFCTRWNGLNKVHSRLEAIDDKEYEGNLLYLLENAENFLKLHSKKKWRKADDRRIEYPDYPERAMKEALVNAIIHRDYCEIGSEIHIDMYDDRLEIYSPGGMEDGTLIQNQDILNISSKRRNPILADLFSRMNLMERRGSGLKKILDYYTMQENYNDDLRSQFYSTTSSFIIKLKNLNYNDAQNVGKSGGQSGGRNDVPNVGQNDVPNVGQNTVTSVGKNDDKNTIKNKTKKNKENDGQNIKELGIKYRRELILKLMIENPKISFKELEAIFNVTKRTLERDLSVLREENKIEFVGSSKTGYWVVKK